MRACNPEKLARPLGGPTRTLTCGRGGSLLALARLAHHRGGCSCAGVYNASLGGSRDETAEAAPSRIQMKCAAAETPVRFHLSPGTPAGEERRPLFSQALHSRRLLFLSSIHAALHCFSCPREANAQQRRKGARASYPVQCLICISFVRRVFHCMRIAGIRWLQCIVLHIVCHKASHITEIRRTCTADFKILGAATIPASKLH